MSNEIIDAIRPLILDAEKRHNATQTLLLATIAELHKRGVVDAVSIAAQLREATTGRHHAAECAELAEMLELMAPKPTISTRPTLTLVPDPESE